MTTTATNLDYAQRPPLRRRRSFRRAVQALIALALIAGVWYFGPTLWREAQLWHYMSQCRDYAAPADTVVCEEVPSWAGNTPPFLSAAPTPRPLSELERLAGPFPAVPLRLRILPPGPVLYMHERTTPGGVRRLVVIRRVPPPLRQSWDAPLSMEVALWKLRPHPLADISHVSWTDPDLLPQAFEANQSTPSLRIFAGQTDPADSSRFTIGFETVDGIGTLEGLLRDGATTSDEPRVEWNVK